MPTLFSVRHWLSRCLSNCRNRVHRCQRLLHAVLHRLPLRLRSPKLSLRTVLVVPFMVQIFLVVGLTGWLSFSNGQQAVNDLVNRLLSEANRRVANHLSLYLEQPSISNRVVMDAIELGLVNPNDPEGMGRLLWQHLRNAPQISTVQFGSIDRHYTGAGRLLDGRLTLKYANPANNYAFQTYLATDKGGRGTLYSQRSQYQITQRPWYQKTLIEQVANWSDVYVMFSDQQLGITLAQPAYDLSNRLLGVVGTDVRLAGIDEFLKTAPVSEHGQVFILERSGEPLASSQNIVMMQGEGTQRRRIKLHELPQLEMTAQAITHQLRQPLSQVAQPEQMHLKLGRVGYFVQIMPFSNGQGLDWLILSLVPESDFIAQIEANTRNTIGVCGVALVLTISVGLAMGRAIGRPIQALNETVQAIAAGDFASEYLLQRPSRLLRVREVESLRQNFQRMSQQLQQSFQTLERSNEQLESRVLERTRELQRNHAELHAQREAGLDGVLVFDEHGYINAYNQRLLDLWQLSEILPLESLEIKPDRLETQQAEYYTRQFLSAILDRLKHPREFLATLDYLGEYPREKTRDEVFLKDGRVFDRYSSPVFSPDGDYYGRVWSFRDVTSRKQAMLAIKEKEAYIRLVLDNIPQQVFWKDTNLVFRGCNIHWAKAAGLVSTDDAIGKTDFDLLPKDLAEAFRTQDREIMEQDRAEMHKIIKKYKPGENGKNIWLDISKLPLHDAEGNVIGIIGVLDDITARKEAEEALLAEQAKSEELLLNILPKPIADQLKADKGIIAKQFDHASILFADIVGFTPMSSEMPPIELVNLLNRIFSEFDHLAEKHHLEKIKTIGDAYMVAGGLPIPREDHAIEIAEMALDMQATIADLRQQLNRQFAIRIGISNGPVVAGVIGIKKFIYDLWGDTVNVASRMESSGMPDRIQVTQSFRDLVSQSYHFEERGLVEIKGKGTMKTYWLLERTQPNLPASLLRDLEEYLPTESHDLKPNRWMI